MNWDEEIDNLVEKKSTPKQGRRAPNIGSPITTDELLDNALDTINDISSSDSHFRPQKSSVWTEEGIKSKNSASVEDERFYNRTEINFDDDDDDIPVIPDIEEIQDDILDSTEIRAPAILINPSTYKELDKELSLAEDSAAEFFYLNRTNDTNLSLLLETLCSEQERNEKDEEWITESLLNDFVSTNTAT
ncbi:hypothetical protein FQA39_LY15224 [Lamprigera yunnana]|nr:hypothetical protein FQA39_LY15224 [Lamprigera yunnana]